MDTHTSPTNAPKINKAAKMIARHIFNNEQPVSYPDALEQAFNILQDAFDEVVARAMGSINTTKEP